MKIAIATLSNRGFSPKVVKSFMELECPHEKMFIMAGDGYTISENRNYIAIQAIKNNCDYVLSIDDDQIFPPDTLTRLLKHDVDIVACKINAKVFPIQHHVQLLDESHLTLQDRMMGKIETPEELFECKAIGTGVILIKTEVFKKIELPWFSTETHENGMTKMGEDYWFCRQARNAGYKIYCDPTLQIGHIGHYIY